MKVFYRIFLILAVLSVLLMTINGVYDYSLNDWYISSVYILMWIFLFCYTVSKVPQKERNLKSYIPSILILFVVLMNIFEVVRRNIS